MGHLDRITIFRYPQEWRYSNNQSTFPKQNRYRHQDKDSDYIYLKSTVIREKRKMIEEQYTHSVPRSIKYPNVLLYAVKV
jgi:hypothetical protein